VFSSHPLKFLGLFILIGLVPLGASSQSLRKIAFTHGGTATASKIAVINEDGTGMTDLTAGGEERDPTWSPDGSQIAFFDNRYGGTNLIRMNADGTAQVPLTDSISPVGSSQPAWSPDGTRIAFVTNRTESRGAEIWVINADGTNPTRVTTNVQRGTDGQGPYFSLDVEPAWSPDSSKIAFWSNRDDSSNPEIYMINADGTNLVRLTNNSIEDKEPIFTADGQHVVFFSRGNGRDGIYEIDLNGSNDHKLTTGVNPTISEDGQKLIVTDFDPSANFAFALFIMNADGSNRTKLTNTGQSNSWEAAWRPVNGPAPPPPPPPPTFTVLGAVYDTGGVPNPGIPGITVTLTGSMSATTTTDANGKYSFTNLPQNGAFTVTVSNPNWGFVNPSRSFNTNLPLFGFIGKTITLDFEANPIFIYFVNDSYIGFEGSNVFFSVDRSGSVLGTATIQYSITDVTAAAGSDYVPVSGTITFKPGDGIKSFPISLIYDKQIEQPETFIINLTNPTGSIARGRQTVVVTINDAPPLIASELGMPLLAVALNGDTLVRDPFKRTTTGLFGQDVPTRVIVFARFIDLVAGEDMTAVTASYFDNGFHDIPVEYVGKVPNADEFTQVTLRLPPEIPAGNISIVLKLRGLTSNPLLIRISP